VNGMALCSGAGGLELGIRLALGPSYRCVCYVEGEAFVAGVLATRMQDGSLDPAPIWDDVSTFDGRPWRGRVDLISAGFPCQPHSQAGERKGTEDQRWIWPSIARIIEEVGPQAVFLENVRGLLTSSDGEAFAQVLGDLASMGFVGSWGSVRASDAGALHIRDRVFVLATRSLWWER